jgi:DNA replication and repair protein RecF
LIIRHLALTEYRNYSSLELDFPPRASIFVGNNAQGKSNLLEAIYILATSRSPRNHSDSELINWDAFDGDCPVCRVVADVERSGGSLTVEIAIGSRDSLSALAPAPIQQGRPGGKSPTIKRIKVNGIARRAADLVGQVNVVLFSVHDIDIIGGEPALRRRYLDAAISQVGREYLRQLQRYHRVMQQRNRLLRQIADNQATSDQLAVWDEELVRSGSFLTVERRRMVSALQQRARTVHSELSGTAQPLALRYVSGVEAREAIADPSLDAVTHAFASRLEAVRAREIAQGVTVVGPHRDDLRIYEGEIDMGIFGSRGQQRTLALSLKLAETGFMLDKTGEHPIVLLDDVLSELDPPRRERLLRYVDGYEQVLLAATDLDDFDPAFVRKAAVFTIGGGSVRRQEP